LDQVFEQKEDIAKSESIPVELFDAGKMTNAN